jgi:hypothetical protein
MTRCACDHASSIDVPKEICCFESCQELAEAKGVGAKRAKVLATGALHTVYVWPCVYMNILVHMHPALPSEYAICRQGFALLWPFALHIHGGEKLHLLASQGVQCFKHVKFLKTLV